MLPPTESLPAITRLLRSENMVVRERLSYGSFVGNRYPYLYLETPKAACTTTKVHLWQLEGLGVAPHPNFVHARPPEDTRQSLRTVGEARAIEALCGTSVFRFCVWRDPVRRLVSTFAAKIHQMRDAAPEWIEYRKMIADEFHLGSEKQITFDHFARFACSQPDDKREPHFMSQWRLTLAEFISYDYIVRVERYAEDMTEVYRNIGVPPSKTPQFAFRANVSGSEAIEVSEATAAMIRDAYRKDYEMVGAVA